jgi:glutamyl-Q tRNA(Asp) synthetase
VLYQSTRTEIYRDLAEDLLARKRAFRCSCTRAQLRRGQASAAEQQRYPGNCRDGHEVGAPTSIRALAHDASVEFDDALQGHCCYDIAAMTGDYVIFRRDGLPAYHLAVVADDAYQGITDVVRGVDLLDSTPLHIHLQRALSLPTPAYAHVPIVVNHLDQKLSKQTGAAPIDFDGIARVAWAALRYLGADPPRELAGARPAELWMWAQNNWTLDTLAHARRIPQYTADVVAEPTID